MPFPVTAKRLIIETTNQAQPSWSGQVHYVFPFFVALQYLNRHFPNTAQDIAMLEYLPHIENNIYLFQYVNDQNPRIR